MQTTDDPSSTEVPPQDLPVAISSPIDSVKFTEKTETIDSKGPDPEIKHSSQSDGPASLTAATADDLERGVKTTTQVQDARDNAYPKREDGSEYPRGIKLFVILLALCLAVFLMALDNSVIATAIPRITDEFNSVTDVGWYGSAYLLTTSSLQLLFGKFYTIWSVKWVYLASIGVFELGSIVCGAAPSSVALITGRAIAGMGASGIFAGSLISLSHSLPLQKRPAYGAAIGGMYGIASITGPILGGALTDHVTWRWCFYINLPIGAAVIVAIILIFPNYRSSATKPETLRERIRRFDPIGTMLFLPALICLLLALKWGGTEYSWSNGRVIALLVVFGVLILAFAGVQFYMQESGTVPPRIISNRTVWAGCAFGFCSGATFFLMVYYVPIWFQVVQEASPVQSGVRLLPMMISVILASLTAGRLVSSFGYYTPLMLVSTVGMSVGAGLISTWNPGTATQNWIGYQILFGATYAMGSQQGLIAVQTVLDMKDIPIGTACVMFIQTLGGAVFVSVGQSVFNNKLISSLSESVPALDPYEILNTGATDVHRSVTADFLPVVVESYSSALTQTFLVAASMAAIKQDYSWEAAAYQDLGSSGLNGRFTPKYYGSYSFNVPVPSTSFVERTVCCILMQKLNGYTMHSLMVKDLTYRIPSKDRLEILGQIMEIKERLEFGGVLHDDVAPRNVVLVNLNLEDYKFPRVTKTSGNPSSESDVFLVGWTSHRLQGLDCRASQVASRGRGWVRSRWYKSEEFAAYEEAESFYFYGPEIVEDPVEHVEPDPDPTPATSEQSDKGVLHLFDS
ncbi:major facilitator superfamily domain-containing protein [Paramyrothecium foliicola]|nr:major facilitator superfamily domain-containing protein [Paramyrothecium foliicola]